MSNIFGKEVCSFLNYIKMHFSFRQPFSEPHVTSMVYLTILKSLLKLLTEKYIKDFCSEELN